MKLLVFAIFDGAAGAYLRPMFVPSNGMAIRAFQGEANDPKSMIYKHPDQFTLFEIGTYDDNTGSLESIVPKSVGNAVQFKDVKNEISDKISILYDELRRYFGDK